MVTTGCPSCSCSCPWSHLITVSCLLLASFLSSIVAILLFCFFLPKAFQSPALSHSILVIPLIVSILASIPSFQPEVMLLWFIDVIFFWHVHFHHGPHFIWLMSIVLIETCMGDSAACFFLALFQQHNKWSTVSRQVCLCACLFVELLLWDVLGASKGLAFACHLLWVFVGCTLTWLFHQARITMANLVQEQSEI